MRHFLPSSIPLQNWTDSKYLFNLFPAVMIFRIELEYWPPKAADMIYWSESPLTAIFRGIE